MSYLRSLSSGIFHPVSVAEPLRLGFLTPHNPYDATAFSGTAAQAFAALDRHPGIDLQLLGPHRRATHLERLMRRGTIRARAEDFDLRPEALGGLDAILGLVASELLDRLPDDAPPALHLTDATPALLAEDYGHSPGPDIFAREARVAERAALCLYSSSTVAARASRDLGLPGLVTEALPFGMNLAPATLPAKTLPGPRIELLFVGLDWDRKGGDIAVAAVEDLRRDGHDIRLTLVGGAPARLAGRPGIEIAGFLDKNNPRDLTRLKTLYARAHLLVLPTRGDCTPMVVAEAMAHGTPVLATDTGGIAETIGGPGAGMLMPMAARASDWADAIIEMTAEPVAWAMMSDAARDRADTGLLTWDDWAQRVLDLARAQVQIGSSIPPARIPA